MMKLSTTLLLTIFTANIIFIMQLIKLQNLSENSSLPNYKATIFLLHINIPNLTSPIIPTVQGHQIHSRKHNGHAQTYLFKCLYQFTKILRLNNKHIPNVHHKFSENYSGLIVLPIDYCKSLMPFYLVKHPIQK